MMKTLLCNSLAAKNRLRFFVLTAALIASIALLPCGTSVAYGDSQQSEAPVADDAMTELLDNSGDSSEEGATEELARVQELLKKAETTYNQAVEAEQLDQKESALVMIDDAVGKINAASNLLDKLESDENASNSSEYVELRLKAVFLRRECMDLFQWNMLDKDKSDAAPRGFRHYLRLVREIFYSPEREDTTCEERASYDYSLCQDETKFEFVCRLLREQRETRPQAFWGFWGLIAALIAFCLFRRCKRRAAAGSKGGEDSAGSNQDAASGQSKDGKDSAGKENK